MKKRMLIIPLIMMIIGFAAVSTTLYINGTIKISTSDDFDIYFSGAELDGVDMSNVFIKDKTHIVYNTNDLKNLNDESELVYEVTNGSKQYNADVEITCTPTTHEYIAVTATPTTMSITAGKVETGRVDVKLIKVSTTEQNIPIECELIVNAVERTSVGDEVIPHGEYSIKGYFVDKNNNPVGNANLVVFSDTPHYVTTDMYGYFYVDGLERGLHEVYYLNTLDPKGMTKEEIKSSSDAKVNIATNNTDDIIFDNDYTIVDQLVKKTDNKTYNITLNANGGTLTSSTFEVTENSKYGNLPVPVKSGYNFLGWYLEDKLITKDVYVTLDLTHELTAKYGAGTYTVTFDANSGAIEGDTSKIVTFNEEYGKLPEPSRYGYDFAGWYDGNELVLSTSKYVTTDNKTLIAHWKAKEITITFNTTGSSIQSKTVKFGESYGTLSDSKKSGSSFNGWYFGENKIISTSVVSIAENHALTASFTTCSAGTYNDGSKSSCSTCEAGFYCTGGSARTACSKGYQSNVGASECTASTYTVTFNAMGGGASSGSKTVTYDSTYGSLPTASRAGYSFNGWFTSSSGGTKIESSTKVAITYNQVLYAQWTANSFYSEIWDSNTSLDANSTSVTVDNVTHDFTGPGYIDTPGNYWFRYGKTLTTLPVGTLVVLYSYNGANTQWYDANTKQWIGTGARCRFTIPSNGEFTMMVYPDVNGHNSSYRRLTFNVHPNDIVIFN